MPFRDFIPENDIDADSYGDSGYQDFVPPKKPVKREVEEKVTPPAPKPEGKKE